MPDFKIINNKKEITLNDKWVPATKFNSKGRLVDEKGFKVSSDYKGRQYRIIEKRERTFSGVERFGRGALGTLAVVCSFCFALFSKSVRNLFTKSKANIRFATLVSDDNPPNIDTVKTKIFTKNSVKDTKDNSRDHNANKDISSSTKTTQTHLNSNQKKIINEFTPQMVEALGGVDEVLSFPILEHWNGEISQKHLSAPIMRGYLQDESPFLVFCYLKRTEYGYEVGGEYLGRREKNNWEGAYSYPSELNLRSPSPILNGSLGEKYMLDKIRRIKKGEAVGTVERFPGVVLIKPTNKASFSPDNAYLKGEELCDYMDVDTLFYEKEPEEGTTEVYLYNPKISKEENVSSLKKKFPGMKRYTF